MGALPEDADYVFNFAVAKSNRWARDLDANAGGRELAHGAPPAGHRLRALLEHRRLRPHGPSRLRRGRRAGRQPRGVAVPPHLQHLQDRRRDGSPLGLPPLRRPHHHRPPVGPLRRPGWLAGHPPGDDAQRQRHPRPRRRPQRLPPAARGRHRRHAAGLGRGRRHAGHHRQLGRRGSRQHRRVVHLPGRAHRSRRPRSPPPPRPSTACRSTSPACTSWWARRRWRGGTASAGWWPPGTRSCCPTLPLSVSSRAPSRRSPPTSSPPNDRWGRTAGHRARRPSAGRRRASPTASERCPDRGR